MTVRKRHGAPGDGRITAAKGSFIVRCPDGHSYDFSAFRSLGLMTRLIVQVFPDTFSNNDDPAIRKTTNRSQFNNLCVFLRWATAHSGAPRPAFNATILEHYHRHLLAGPYALATVIHYFHAVCRIARLLFEKRLAQPFLIPANGSQREALAAGQGSRTLVDLCPRAVAELGPDLANHDLLKRLLLACDRRARQLEDRLALGEKWRREVSAGEFAPPLHLADTPLADWRMSRDDLVHLACKLALYCWEGEIAHRDVALRAPGPAEALFRCIVWNRVSDTLRAAEGESITLAEIRSYLAPTNEYFAALYPLLTASGVNPHSVLRLRTSNLQFAPDAPETFAYLVVEKPRAGGEIRLGPFRVGTEHVLSLPQLWQRIARATERVRASAPRNLANFLFLGRSVRGESGRRCAIRPGGAAELCSEYLRPWLRTQTSDPDLVALADGITNKIVRATAINLAYATLGRDSSLSAIPFGHSQAVLDMTYIVSGAVRAALEDTMSRAQSMLEAWLRSPIAVVDNRIQAIRDAAHVDAPTARAIQRDEWTRANGLCLLKDTAFVVDSPLNCLRMMQWLEKLRAERARMQREQPERWSLRYAPQIPLFEDALHDFSRRSRRSAERLHRRIALPMEEIA